MHCVYIIQSINWPDRVYVGSTTNLKKRLSDHNAGTTAHTKQFKPWNLIVSLEFKDKQKALEFEKYLKSGSGRAFRTKRFL